MLPAPNGRREGATIGGEPGSCSAAWKAWLKEGIVVTEYKIVWFPEFVIDKGKPVVLEDTSKQVNQWVGGGWAVHQVVPGTNAQTFSGLFVTFVKN